tara:strand:+ start:885 stop:1301 length:417 start_codon:yes stop_codon:yes gene_type:complete
MLVNNRSKEKGFTLIEAIVALVILSGAMLVTFAWTDNVLRQTEKIVHRVDAHKILKNFLADLDSIDEIEVGEKFTQNENYSLMWKTELVDEAPGVLSNGVKSNFDLSLFSVYIEIRRGGEMIAIYNTRKTGFRLRGDQ